MLVNEVFSHQGYIYLIKNTVKTLDIVKLLCNTLLQYKNIAASSNYWGQTQEDDKTCQHGWE